MTSTIPPFDADILEGIGEVLGDTDRGLTHREIGFLLSQCNIDDVDPSRTKRIRICDALLTKQQRTRSGKCVVAFVVAAMKPSRYRNDPASRSWRQDSLNEVLVHAGLRVDDAGRVARLKEGKARTLDEAAKRASTIRTELKRRNTHPDVMLYCTDEILNKNNFHALLEATKSITGRIQALSNLTDDGADLVHATLSPASGPLLAINSGHDRTDRSEQSGFSNLVTGVLGLYRNPTAHTPRIRRTVSDEELYEAFATISMVHRRLDSSTNHSRP